MGNVPIYKIMTQRRTIRRFKQKTIPFSFLKKLVDAARLAPSAANLQPLEFAVVNDKDVCSRIFTHLKWAGYIAPHGIPPINKRPAAYIVVLVNIHRTVKKYFAYDVGFAVENILLLSWQEGIGGCCMQAINRRAIRRILRIPGHLKVNCVVSLGYRDEMPRVEVLKDSVKYWKDKYGKLHVPKRSLKSILHHNFY